jgi:hypothetical protein
MRRRRDVAPSRRINSGRAAKTLGALTFRSAARADERPFGRTLVRLDDVRIEFFKPSRHDYDLRKSGGSPPQAPPARIEDSDRTLSGQCVNHYSRHHDVLN